MISSIFTMRSLQAFRGLLSEFSKGTPISLYILLYAICYLFPGLGDVAKKNKKLYLQFKSTMV